ncbi:MAG: hypothetical protein QOI66_2897, partial [Myxococcales bacterium]|nr:hypothetical protein [Myxococcales bacterium]
TLYPQWTADVGADAARETEAFAVAVTLDMNGSFQTLMNGQFSYVNERLAVLYGLPNVTGTDFQKVNLDPGRAGLLTHPSLLAMNSHPARTAPTNRGNFIRGRFYCEAVPPPSSDMAPMVTLPPNPTTRQQLEAQVAGATCATCHDLTDPIGFAFEGFDTVGHARTTDNGSPVDTTGKIKNGAGVDTSFKGAVDLVGILTDIDQVQSCLGRNWLQYALGRTIGASDDATVTGLHTAFKSAGLDIRALIAAVAQSDLFLAP